MSFRPVNSRNSYSQNWGQVNDMLRSLNKEQITKAYKQSGGNSVITGKLPGAGYGSLYYDSTNTPRAILGTDANGDFVFAVSKEGNNVLDNI